MSLPQSLPPPHLQQRQQVVNNSTRILLSILSREILSNIGKEITSICINNINITSSSSSIYQPYLPLHHRQESSLFVSLSIWTFESMCGFCAITDINASHIYQHIIDIAKSEQILRWDATCHISVSCWLFHTLLSTVSISYTYRTDLHRMPRPVTMYNCIYVWVLCHDISTYRRHCKIWANSKVRSNMPP